MNKTALQVAAPNNTKADIHKSIIVLNFIVKF